MGCRRGSREARRRRPASRASSPRPTNHTPARHLISNPIVNLLAKACVAAPASHPSPTASTRCRGDVTKLPEANDGSVAPTRWLAVAWTGGAWNMDLARTRCESASQARLAKIKPLSVRQYKALPAGNCQASSPPIYLCLLEPSSIGSPRQIPPAFRPYKKHYRL